MLRKLRTRRRVIIDIFRFEYLIVLAEKRYYSLILAFNSASIKSFRYEELELRYIIEYIVALEEFIDYNIDIALDCAK